jgi:hypothetical protein
MGRWSAAVDHPFECGHARALEVRVGHHGVVGAIADGRRVSAALDPILTMWGFAGGQYGQGGEERDTHYLACEVIFCAAHDDFSDRFPWLPQSNQQPRDVGTCTDLIIQISDGRFDSASFEHLSLEETLRVVGHTDDAGEVSRVQGAALDDALPILTGALERLFHTRDA